MAFDMLLIPKYSFWHDTYCKYWNTAWDMIHAVNIRIWHGA